MVDSVFRSGKNYYPQVFLEECKLEVKEQKMPVHITDDMEISSNDSDRKDLMKKFPMKKILYRMCLLLYLKHLRHKKNIKSM